MSSVLDLETPGGPRQAASSVEPRSGIPKATGPYCKDLFRRFNAQRVKPIDCPQSPTPPKEGCDQEFKEIQGFPLLSKDRTHNEPPATSHKGPPTT